MTNNNNINSFFTATQQQHKGDKIPETERQVNVRVSVVDDNIINLNNNIR